MTTTQSVILTIPRPPPPALNRQERMRWRDRWHLRRMWGMETLAAWCNAGQPTFIHPAITVRCYYAHGRVFPDPDGRGVIVKPGLDALKGRAWAGDDDEMGYAGLRVLCFHSDEPRVEIELVERGTSERSIGAAADDGAGV